jgi:hypothetical protein
LPDTPTLDSVARLCEPDVMVGVTDVKLGALLMLKVCDTDELF